MIRRTRIILLVAVLTGNAGSAGASTVHVPEDFLTVQGALDAMTAGDTIVVSPGQYVESLTLAKDIVLRGVSNPGTVVLRAPAGSRVLRIDPSAATARFENVTFTGGKADSGGAVYIAAGVSCAFLSCRFLNNTARGIGGDYFEHGCSFGGALFVGAAAGVVLEDCEFRDNLADFGEVCFDGNGGAIYTAEQATLTARRSRFVGNGASGFEGGYGGVVGSHGYTMATNTTTTTFEDCAFDSNAGGWGGVILARGGLMVQRCVFRRNYGGYAASAISFTSTTGYDITGSVFHDNDAFHSATLTLSGPGRLEGNTLAFNTAGTGGPFGCVQLGLGTSTVRNNVIARNRSYGIVFSTPPPPDSITCNDTWRNAGGDYRGAGTNLTGIGGNIAVDPMFCDSTLRILYLRAGSPCAPGPTCGLIGALSAECPTLGVPGIAAASVQLLPVVPNPMGRTATFRFRLSRPADVRLAIVDVRGRHVAWLAKERLGPGFHERAWRSRDDRGERVAPGVYFVRLVAEGAPSARKFVVIEGGR